MNLDEWAQRARSFGQVAALYDRWRPSYPGALYADVLELGSGGQILEAGAGTGRATLALARRGASVVAIEPDAAMAAIARQRTHGMAVHVLESTFEDCAVAPRTSAPPGPRKHPGGPPAPAPRRPPTHAAPPRGRYCRHDRSRPVSPH